MLPARYSLSQICIVKNRRPDQNQIEAQVASDLFFLDVKALLWKASASLNSLPDRINTGELVIDIGASSTVPALDLV